MLRQSKIISRKDLVSEMDRQNRDYNIRLQTCFLEHQKISNLIGLLEPFNLLTTYVITIFFYCLWYYSKQNPTD